MKIVLTTKSETDAKSLKANIIKTIKDGEEIDTWSHKKASNTGSDMIYHNPDQYVKTPEKNVIFRVDLDKENVSFTTTIWKDNPNPTEEMKSYHVGRLTEVLLAHFRDSFEGFYIEK